MDIQEKIKWLRRVMITIAVAFAVVMSIRIFQKRSGGAGELFASTARLFYSDDDGKTWFADESTKIPPFDHNGKQAVRAQVFRCRGAGPFVGYLLRYGAAAKATIAATERGGVSSFQMRDEPMEAKKPGETKWVGGDSTKPDFPEYLRIIRPVCPDGGTEGLIPVEPTDSGNGATN